MVSEAPREFAGEPVRIQRPFLRSV
jgi:hypothetical protein